MPNKVVFLSDIHAGEGKMLDSDAYPYEWCTKKMSETGAKFIDHLAENPAIDKVVLLGDIMDTNVCPIDCAPPTYQGILDSPKHEKLFNSLRNLSGRKSLYLLHGNHDIDYDQNNILSSLPNAKFCNNDTFEDEMLVALHGHSYFMWCAPDNRSENIFKPLPIGYFLSRIGATHKTRTGSTSFNVYQIIQMVVAALGLRIFDPKNKTMVEKVIKHTVSWAKIDMYKEKIIMPGGQNVAFSDVIDSYMNLPEVWQNNYPKGSWQDFMIAWGDLFFQEWLNRGKKIFIAGHSHEETIRPDLYQDNVNNGIYANCGKWCCDDPHFVESERDMGRRCHYVRLMKWDDKKRRALLRQPNGELSIPI